MSEQNWAQLVKPSDVGIERTRGESAPNPLKGVLEQSAKNDFAALQLPVKDGKEAKQVTDLLRRDSKEGEWGVSIQYRNGRGERVPNVKNEKGVTVPDISKARQVHFQAKAKTERQYDTNDVIAWAIGAGKLDQNHTGKVPAEVRKEFRRVNGFEKDPAQATV